MLFAAIQPDNTWQFPVSDTHPLYIEESGNPEGVPVVFYTGVRAAIVSPVKYSIMPDMRSPRRE